MKKKIFSILFALVLVLSFSLVTAVPVAVSAGPDTPELELTYDSGQNEINKEAGHPYIEWTIAGNKITFDFHNPLGSDYACAFDYRVDGEPGMWTEWSDIVKGGAGELAGQEIGPSYNIVNVGAETETVTVTAGKEVKVGLRLQSESDWDLDWIVFELPSPVVGVAADIGEGIVAINVTPTSIDFGPVQPGQSSSSEVITVENIGFVPVRVMAELDKSGTVFDYLQLDGKAQLSNWGITDLLGGNLKDVSAQLVVPRTYSAKGVETATLTFIATAIE